MATIRKREPQTKRTVLFSDDYAYRYILSRTWDASLRPLVFIMLNPSTADLLENDPTVERCERRARTRGYGSVWIGNAFAFRSTDPAIMKQQSDPVGKLNDVSLRKLMFMAKERGGTVIVGWGNTHGTYKNRHLEVIAIASDVGIQLHCLAYTKGGHPQHPLYIAYEEKPKPWPRSWVLKKVVEKLAA